jgi:hypothetical protein
MRKIVLLGTLIVLVWSSLSQAEKILYKGKTHIGGFAYANAGTIVNYDSKGTPDFIGFANSNGIIQGKYGIDGTGQAENKGRLIYKQTNKGFPFVVTGQTNIYKYNLKYLELTTVGNKEQGYRAYAIKAIAFDNKVDTLSEKNITYKMPEGGQLVIDHGKIKIGDNNISPNYNSSGQIP